MESNSNCYFGSSLQVDTTTTTSCFVCVVLAAVGGGCSGAARTSYNAMRVCLSTQIGSEGSKGYGQNGGSKTATMILPTIVLVELFSNVHAKDWTDFFSEATGCDFSRKC